MSRPTILLIDPTIRMRSGIATYCSLATPLINELGYRVRLLKRDKEEDLPAFRRRVAQTVHEIGVDLAWVEAPETGASTMEVPIGTRIHLRVHCPRGLPTIFVGGTPDQAANMEEAQALTKATLVSAPTMAAWRETLRIHHLRDVRVFPNPAPMFVGGQAWAERRGIALIGRAQDIKGPQILAALIPHLPSDLRIVMAGAGMPEVADCLNIRHRVEAHDEIDSATVKALMGSVRVVLVPSLFETFSMVAAEALATGTQVVTWGHSGAAELATDAIIHTVPAWNLTMMAAKIMEALNAEPEQGSAETACTALRAQFLTGQRALLDGTSIASPTPTADFAPPAPVALCALPRRTESADMKKAAPDESQPPAKSKSSAWMTPAKWKKLKQNPAAFLRDMKLVRSFSSVLGRMGMPASQAHGQITKPAENPTVKNVGTVKSNSTQENHAAAKPHAKPKAGPAKAPARLAWRPASELGPDFAEVDFKIVLSERASNPRMHVEDHGPKDVAWATMVYIPSGHEDPGRICLQKVVLDACSSDLRDSFIGYRDNQLFLAEVEIMTSLNALERLNRIDLATKRKLARYRTHVFCDPVDKLPDAIRGANTESYIVVILSQSPPADLQLPDVDQLDVLIAPDGWEIPPGHQGKLRRVLRYGEGRAWSQPAYALRRAIRELGPRPKEALLPVVGGTTPMPGLIDIDVSSTQAILQLENFDWSLASKATDFASFCQILEPLVTDLLVTEGLFLRYRDLTDAEEKDGRLSQFLSLATKDGARFDVRHG